MMKYEVRMRCGTSFLIVSAIGVYSGRFCSGFSCIETCSSIESKGVCA